MTGLSGKCVVITRVAEQSIELGVRFRALGATVANVPVILIVPPADEAPLAQAVADFATFDWVVFTSSNGVRAVLTRLPDAARNAKRPQLAAVGPATARAITDAGFPVAHVAESTGLGLAHSLPRMTGLRVLVPHSNIGLPDVPDALRAQHALVTEVVAYATIADPYAVTLLQQLPVAADVMMFTSPSTVAHFLAAASANAWDIAAMQQQGLQCVCIGPTTAAAAVEHGLCVDAVATHPTPEALVVATAGLFHD